MHGLVVLVQVSWRVVFPYKGTCIYKEAMNNEQWTKFTKKRKKITWNYYWNSKRGNGCAEGGGWWGKGLFSEKKKIHHVSCVMCCVSTLTCHMSLTPTATAMDPTPALLTPTICTAECCSWSWLTHQQWVTKTNTILRFLTMSEPKAQILRPIFFKHFPKGILLRMRMKTKTPTETTAIMIACLYDNFKAHEQVLVNRDSLHGK